MYNHCTHLMHLSSNKLLLKNQAHKNSVYVGFSHWFSQRTHYSDTIYFRNILYMIT